MIEIRPDQIQMFLDKVRSTFVKRAASYVRANHRNKVDAGDAAALESWIRAQIAAAENHGITTEAAVMHFIELVLAFGEDFHSSGKHPEAEKILALEIPGELKILELQESARRGFEPASSS